MLAAGRTGEWFFCRGYYRHASNSFEPYTEEQMEAGGCRSGAAVCTSQLPCCVRVVWLQVCASVCPCAGAFDLWPHRQRTAHTLPVLSLMPPPLSEGRGAKGKS